jgi:hypothetical protein
MVKTAARVWHGGIGMAVIGVLDGTFTVSRQLLKCLEMNLGREVSRP